MPTRIADIICIAQITFKIIHSALLAYNGLLLFLHFNCVFDLSAGANRTDLGVYLSAFARLQYPESLVETTIRQFVEEKVVTGNQGHPTTIFGKISVRKTI